MMDKRKGIGFGIFLLTVGMIWLLSIFNIVTINTLYALLQFWPLILVAAGIGFIFRSNRVVKTGVWLVLTAGIICFGYYGSPRRPDVAADFLGFPWAHDRYAADIVSKAEGLAASHNGTVEAQNGVSARKVVYERKSQTQEGELYLQYGAAQLSIDSAAAGLLEAYVDTDVVEYSQRYKDNDRVAVIDFEMERLGLSKLDDLDDFVHEFHLSKDVIWEIELDSGAVKSELDLSGLKIKSLDIDTGASDLRIRMGSYDAEFMLDAGASKIDITLPEDTGMKLNLDGGVNSVNLEGSGWVKKGNWQYSPGFDDKQYKVTAEVDMGLGSLTIR